MKKDQVEYDINDLLNAVRCAYYSEFKKSLGDKALIEFAEQIVDKPFQMLPWMRNWLLNCGESECPTIVWLRQFI